MGGWFHSLDGINNHRATGNRIFSKHKWRNDSLLLLPTAGRTSVTAGIRPDRSRKHKGIPQELKNDSPSGNGRPFSGNGFLLKRLAARSHSIRKSESTTQPKEQERVS
jgi:hypothetical protein